MFFKSPTDVSRTDLYVLHLCFCDIHAVIFQMTQRRLITSIPQVWSQAELVQFTNHPHQVSLLSHI